MVEHHTNDDYRYRAGQVDMYAGDIHSKLWRPVTTIYMELRKDHIACLVGVAFEGGFWRGALMDVCDNRASLSMIYAVDVLRSVARGEVEDAKYVRITVSPSSAGGAGWHLIERPWHRHTWFESWTNRVTWFGPIADQYQVTLKGYDRTLELFNSIPASHVRYSQVSGRSTIRIAFPVRGPGSPFVALAAEEELDELHPDVDLHLPGGEDFASDAGSGESGGESSGPDSESLTAMTTAMSDEGLRPAVWTAEKLQELFGSAYEPDLSDISEVSDSDSSSVTDLFQERKGAFWRRVPAYYVDEAHCSDDSVVVMGEVKKRPRRLRTALQLMPILVISMSVQFPIKIMNMK